MRVELRQVKNGFVVKIDPEKPAEPQNDPFTPSVYPPSALGRTIYHPEEHVFAGLDGFDGALKFVHSIYKKDQT